MARYCRKLLKKSGQADVNVSCLNISIEGPIFKHKAENIDILVAPVFCFDTVIQLMPKLITHQQRLRYVWFHEIDEMCQIDEERTYNATDKLVPDDGSLDIQVK